jgi:penicillin-insensitive murein DD-endopeptidase
MRQTQLRLSAIDHATPWLPLESPAVNAPMKLIKLLTGTKQRLATLRRGLCALQRQRLAAQPSSAQALRNLLLAGCFLPFAAFGAESVCFGKVSNGRLEAGVKLPAEGVNFYPYSSLAVTAGRTYVHSRVAKIVEESYAALAKSMPETVFVYGETGWRSGGRFQPHRTHQNGLSVDFFVPVLNHEGKSVPIPTFPTTRFGYDLEFNAAAQLDGLRIDFVALAEHLYHLNLAAKRNKSAIALVIFDPAYLDRLFATPRGAKIRSLPFMKGQPWVRHDEHIHVDFAVPCRELKP